MANRPDHAHAALTEAAAIIRRLTADWAAWHDKVTDWSLDGFPARQGDTAGSSTAPGSKAPPGYGDADPYRANLTDQYGDLAAIIGCLRDMDTRRRTVVNVIREAAPEYKGLPECANAHGCPDSGWAVRRGRCQSCYAYLARNNRDRRGAKAAA